MIYEKISSTFDRILCFQKSRKTKDLGKFPIWANKDLGNFLREGSKQRSWEISQAMVTLNYIFIFASVTHRIFQQFYKMTSWDDIWMQPQLSSGSNPFFHDVLSSQFIEMNHKNAREKYSTLYSVIWIKLTLVKNIWLCFSYSKYRIYFVI